MKVLKEINKELTRLCLAGSLLGKEDLNLKRYLPALNKLGEKSPIFKTLEEKIKAFIEEGEDFCENIMEALTIVHSILHTQGSVQKEEFNRKVQLSRKNIKFQNISCTKLKTVKDNLIFNPNGFGKDIVDIYRLNVHSDIRLYESYCKSINEHSLIISNYVEKTIISSVGLDIVPFLKNNINTKGNKKDAKLFKLLYKIIGSEIIPLSFEIIKKGSGILLAEALYTLWENKEYEETLLFYTRKGKAEVRRAAFTSLIKMESDKGENLLIKGIKKINLGHLYEAIEVTKSSKIINEVLNEIDSYRKNGIDSKYNTKIESLIDAITKNNSKESLNFIQLVFEKKEDFKDIFSVFNENQILFNLQEQNTKESNNLLYNISKNDYNFAEFRIRAYFRLFSEDEVYEKCLKIIKDNIRIYSYIKEGLIEKYNINVKEDMPDSEKKWNGKWIDLFLYGRLKDDVDIFLKSDDTERWTRLLNLYTEDIPRHGKYFFYDSGYSKVLGKAFKNKHPKAKDYYSKFIKSGYEKEKLKKDLQKYRLTINDDKMFE